MVRELTPELAKIAKEELNENPKQILNDLNQIKEWISKQHHLKARTDDQWLLALLRGCKFSLEKVKVKIDFYYSLRSSAPEITLRLKPTQPEFLDFIRIGTIVILPKPKTGLNPRMILIRPGMYDPQVNSVADVMCALYYLVQILLMEDDTSTILGTKVLVDYEGVTMTHLTQANPSLLRKMILVGQDSLPLRLRGSHHFNLPTGIEIIFTLISGFLNEKAKQRLRIHKNVDDILEFVPKEILPTEYGGDGGSLREILDHWVSKIVEYKTWMQQEEQFGSDESRRIKISSDEVVGSFRSLDID
ncbi:unnamed protein product [Chilo suppressalis]|uniref:CRAL-TRIO domain-containing protein n=1 Tax=Chilo suppressalis TaxID=168631 RepID=A0ABN8BB92_CHISP|nr:unnamed protein product [Chilo suppressalis]